MRKTIKDIEKAYEVLDELNQDQALMAAYLSQQIGIMDQKTRLIEATELGRKQGIEIGRKWVLDKA